MDLNRDHIIHSRSGQLGDQVTTVADAKRIAARAWDQGKNGGIVLHFHGGLVNEGPARAGARRLYETYATAAGAYPIFSIWESGLLETVRHNLKDILKDSVFQELVKKVSEWVLKEGAPGLGLRGAGGGPVDAEQLRRDYDRWFADAAAQPPIPDSGGGPPIPGLRGSEPDVDELALKIEAELEDDAGFQQTMAGLAVSSGRTDANITLKGTAVQPKPVEVLVDQEALDEMFPSPGGAGVRTKGVLSWVTVARFVAKVVVGVIKRTIAGRDHGG
jgi:hypothetical protein